MLKFPEILFSHFYKASSTAEILLIKTYISSLKENLPKEEDASSDTLLASYFAYLKGKVNHDATPPYENWVHIWEKMDLTSEDEVEAAEKIKKITDNLVKEIGFHDAFVLLSRAFQLAEALRKEGRRDTTPLFSEALENLALENPIEYESLDLGNLRISEGVLEAYKKTCSKKMITKIFFGSFVFLTGHFVKFYMNATVSTHNQESSITPISILSDKSIAYWNPETVQQSSQETNSWSVDLFTITTIALPILLGAYWLTKYFTQKLQGSSEDNRLSQIEVLSSIHHSNRKPEHKTTQIQVDSLQNKLDASFESKDNDNLGNSSSIIFTDVKNKGSKREKTPSKNEKDKLKKIRKFLKESIPSVHKICTDKSSIPTNNKEPLTKLISSVRKIRTDKSFIPSNKDDDFECTPAALKIIELAELNLREEIKEHVHSPARIAAQEKVLAHGPNLSAHGVEAGKGGLRNLLNIMLEGLIRTKWWGSLRAGDSSFSAGVHGPYYVIIDGRNLKKDEKKGKRLRINMIDEVYHIAYLVPHPRYRTFIFKVLDKAEEVEMLTKEEVKNLKDKVITYGDFLGYPKTATKSITSFKKYLNSNKDYKIQKPLKDTPDHSVNTSNAFQIMVAN